MPTLNIKAPDGKTLRVPFSGEPPSDADVQDIINQYEVTRAKPNASPGMAALVANVAGTVGQGSQAVRRAAPPLPSVPSHVVHVPGAALSAPSPSLLEGLAQTVASRAAAARVVKSTPAAPKTLPRTYAPAPGQMGMSAPHAPAGIGERINQGVGNAVAGLSNLLHSNDDANAASGNHIGAIASGILAAPVDVLANALTGEARSVKQYGPMGSALRHVVPGMNPTVNAAAEAAVSPYKPLGLDAVSDATRALAHGDRAGAVRILKAAPPQVWDYINHNKLETLMALAPLVHAVPAGVRGLGDVGRAVGGTVREAGARRAFNAQPRGPVQMAAPGVKPTTITLPGVERGQPPPGPAVAEAAAPHIPAPEVNIPAPSRLVPDHPVANLHVDPERFQYKMGAGAGGQTGSLTGAETWNPNLAGVLHVWDDPADGKTYVVNGHNRYSLAERTGQATVDVRKLDAATPEEARTQGALINVAEGHGTPLDAAKLFRDGGITPEQLKSQGVNLSGSVAQKGLALSNLSPPLFGQAVRGEIPLERAAIIGERLPKAEDQHALVSLLDRAAKKGKTITNDVVTEMADQAGAAPVHTETTSTLFGDEETTQNLALQRAEVAAYVKAQLGKEGAAFGQAAKNADRLARGNNVIDAETSGRIATASRQGAEVFERTKNQAGPVSDILNTAAQRLAKGEKPDVVKQDALRQFQDAVPSLAQSPRPAGQAALGFGEAGDAQGGPRIEGGPGDPAQSARGGGAPGPDGGAVRPQPAAPSVAVPAGAHGTPIRDLNAPAKPNPTPTATSRVAPAPIAGGVPKKLSQITLDLSKAVGRRVGVAKLGRGVAGTYFPSSAKTSIRFAGDLDTTAHEIAHALDDAHGLVAPWKAKRVKSPFDAELKPFWEAGGSATKSGPRSLLAYKRAEGVAEFIRAYIVNPDEAKARAPQFYQHFVNTIPADVLGKIHDFSFDVRQFAGLDASEKIGANVGLHGERITRTQALVTAVKGEGWDFETTGLDRLQAAVQDTLKPFSKAVEAARQLTGKGALPANDPMVLARLHSGLGGKVLNILDKGMIDAEGKRVTSGGIDWLLDPFDKSTHEALTQDLDDTVKLMIAQRTLEKGAHLGRDRVSGIGGGLYSDLAVARQALKEFGADPARLARLEEGAKRYREWADKLLQYQVQKGRMSQAAYDAIKANNDQYVALQREMDKINPPRVGSGNSSTKLGSAKQTVQAFKGSTREIKNPYRTLMDQTQAMVGEADRNEVLRAFRDMLTVQRGMHDGPVQNLAAIGQRAKVGDPNTVRIFVDGKPEYWQFEKGVYESLKGVGSELQLPKISTLLPSLMRSAVTHSPGFLVRNVFRDAIDRTLLSKHGGKPWDVIGKTSEADRDAFDLAGGGQAGHYLVSKEGYGKAVESAIQKLSGDKKTVFALPGDFLERYQHLAHSSEMVGRYAEYKKAFAHAKTNLGYDDYNASLYAASEARGLMDFAVAGNVGRVINQYVPFTNAAVQGGVNLLRAARANPAAFMGRWAAYVVIPELAVYAWNMSQGKATRDEYRQLPAYQKDLFWNFKVGPDTWVRIPKGFEMATLASGVSRAIDQAAGNKDAFDGYTGSLAKSLIPLDEQAFAGPLRPVVENMANYDFFRGATIVPPYEDKLRLDLRKGTGNASRLGQALGKVMGADPRKVDHFVRAQTGDLGGLAEKASDIGRADRPAALLQTGLPLSGLLTQSPATAAPDVQAVMNASQQLGRRNPLKDEMDTLYAAQTPAQRDQAARDLRERAHELRPALQIDLSKPPDLLKKVGESRARRHGPSRPSRPHR